MNSKEKDHAGSRKKFFKSLEKEKTGNIQTFRKQTNKITLKNENMAT